MPTMTYLIIILGLSVLIVAFFVLKNVFFSVESSSILKYVQQKNYPQAVKQLKKLVQANDHNSFAHYYLGETYFLMENLEWALPHFKKVIQLNKYTGEVKEVIARERIAEIYLHFQQLEEAQKEFLLILNIKPNDYQYHYKIGEIFYQRHYKENAAAYFQKALDLNPSHADSLFRLGEIHYDSKHPSEALLSMKKCLKSDAGCHKAHYYMGMVYLDSHNFHQATQEFNISIKDSEYRLRSIYQTGRAYVESGNLDKGIVELDRGLSFITQEDNTALALRYLLARAYESIRDLPAAMEQWEAISMVNPKYQDVKDKLDEYEDLRVDDVLKDFLTASDSKFESICRNIVQNLKLEILEFSLIRGTVANIIATEVGSEWRAQRKSKHFIRVCRLSDQLGDKVIREVLEEMKKATATKGYIVSSTEFTRQAIDYAESRPIELYDKSQLSKILS